MSDNEIVGEFLVESYENLDRLEREMVSLEKDPNNAETLASIFRTIHTIKGTCGFLGFSKLESVAHVGENLLSKIRDGLVHLNPDSTSALLSMVDAVRQMLNSIENAGDEGERNDAELIATLTRLQTTDAVPKSATPAPQAAVTPVPAAVSSAPPAPAPTSAPAQKDAPVAPSPQAAAAPMKESAVANAAPSVPPAVKETAPQVKPIVAAPTPDVAASPKAPPPAAPSPAATLAKDATPLPAPSAVQPAPKESSAVTASTAPLAAPKPVAIAAASPAEVPAKSPVPAETKAATEKPVQAPPVKLSAPPVSESAALLKPPEPTPIAVQVAGQLSEPAPPKPVPIAEAQHPQAMRSQPSVADSTIRVDVGLLDKLGNLVGELVLARNQIMQFTNSSEDSNLMATSQRLNLLTTEIQAGVMKTRMQPIGNIWSKLPRTVRDLAIACGKEVSVEMEGQDTELDKTIIEAIKDPLTHLVRNTVDHGIEKPEVRRAAGKNSQGCLQLRAFHEGGQVIIEVSDDGGGLDADRIRKKAIERALVTQEQAARMAEPDVFQMIFQPGFSTAEKVTNVSGRGVGMDVVKTNVEKIGGSVNIQSKRGQGTTVRIKIPLTLAIVPALIVTCAGDRFAIPQVSLTELVRLEADEVENGIEMVHGAPVHRLRGHLLPLVNLAEELKLRSGARAGAEHDGAVNIVVLQSDGQPFGLVVDAVNDTEEIVVKPLRTQLKSLKTFAGASIMGDGRVALILDVMGLAQRSNVISEARHRRISEKRDGLGDKVAEKKQSFLVFAGPDDGRMALPLDTLERLEELPASAVEKSGKHWLAQYRGQILPLIHLASALEDRRSELRNPRKSGENGDSAPLDVLVCNYEGQSIGIVVEDILDIVEESAEVRHPASRPGVLYSAVIGGRVTELIDIPAVLRAAGLKDAREAELVGAGV